MASALLSHRVQTFLQGVENAAKAHFPLPYTINT